ncbi:GDP-mannose 4,6-dehydratase [Succinimonas amylolytica]|uniref:GDP-mannose 4,6-dehydratase n=1 Tax=Succinimonas amylolytica TaxID=83769 RepID=UPI00039EBEB9|nr:GDP-mannose 4,6-dehydratase [Succinimonas amylolytica]
MDNYLFVKGGVCDENFITAIFNNNDIKGVIHFAQVESHVDNSIKLPRVLA